MLCDETFFASHSAVSLSGGLVKSGVREGITLSMSSMESMEGAAAVFGSCRNVALETSS